MAFARFYFEGARGRPRTLFLTIPYLNPSELINFGGVQFLHKVGIPSENEF